MNFLSLRRALTVGGIGTGYAIHREHKSYRKLDAEIRDSVQKIISLQSNLQINLMFRKFDLIFKENQEICLSENRGNCSDYDIRDDLRKKEKESLDNLLTLSKLKESTHANQQKLYSNLFFYIFGKESTAKTNEAIQTLIENSIIPEFERPGILFDFCGWNTLSELECMPIFQFQHPECAQAVLKSTERLIKNVEARALACLTINANNFFKQTSSNKIDSRIIKELADNQFTTFLQEMKPLRAKVTLIGKMVKELKEHEKSISQDAISAMRAEIDNAILEITPTFDSKVEYIAALKVGLFIDKHLEDTLALEEWSKRISVSEERWLENGMKTYALGAMMISSISMAQVCLAMANELATYKAIIEQENES